MTELTPEALAILAGGDAPAKKGGLLQTIVVVAGLTLIALAGGSGLGYVLGGAPAAPAPAAAPTEADAAPAADKAPTTAASSETILPLEPVLADIASPPGTQIRLEASLVLGKTEEDTALLATKIQADMIVFVRTLELAQLEGSRGLLHMKEDLLERAKLRSPAVTDLVVRSLVVK